MAASYVDVMLVPVTKEESEKLRDVARTLYFLSQVTGSQEHREQADYVEAFASKRGRWEAQYSVALPTPADDDE